MIYDACFGGMAIPKMLSLGRPRCSGEADKMFAAASARHKQLGNGVC